MCGIVGLFLKDARARAAARRADVGHALDHVRARAGFGGLRRLRAGPQGKAKITLQSPTPERDFAGLRRRSPRPSAPRSSLERKSTHAVLTVPADKASAAREALRIASRRCASWAPAKPSRSTRRSATRPRSPRRFDLAKMKGTHAIGHTRMATESAVTTMGAHPFSTGADQCLVHNGSLSNHNNLRRQLIHDGMTLRDRERYRGRRRLHHLAHEPGHEPRRSADEEPRRPRRLLHLRRRHQERLWRAARSHRLQARRHGGDRPVRRLRLGISRARRPARHRQRQGLGARARDRLLLERRMERQCAPSISQRRRCAS